MPLSIPKFRRVVGPDPHNGVRGDQVRPALFNDVYDVVEQLDGTMTGAEATAVQAASDRHELQRFDVEKYGASTDGSGDNTAAVLAAMAAAKLVGGGVIWLPRPVDYLCETVSSGGGLSWVIAVAQDNISFEGVPGSGLKTTQNASLIHLCGAGKTVGASLWANGWLHGGSNSGRTPTVPVHAIDGSLAKGTVTVPLDTIGDAANYAVGDLVYIRTGHTLGAGAPNSTQPDAEINEVAAVDTGTGVITLRWPTAKAYAPEVYPAGHAEAGLDCPYGIANVDDKVIRNVAFRGIRLISTHASAQLMPEGQVYGLTIEDCHIETGHHFQSLNNIRMGRYRRNTVLITEAGAAGKWWFTTATGTTDVEISDNYCTAKGVGNLHLHEGSTQVSVLGGTYCSSNAAISTQVVSIRARAYDFILDGLTIIGGSSSTAPVYVDETCVGGGTIDNMTIVTPTATSIAIATGTWKLGSNLRLSGNASFAGPSGGPMDQGIDRGVRSVSGWLADNNTSMTLGRIPAGSVTTNVWVWVTEAFNSDGTDIINVGIPGNEYVYAYNFDVAATTKFHVPLLGTITGSGAVRANMGFRPNAEEVVAFYNAGGSAPTTGKALVILEYIPAPAQIS